MSSRLLAVVSVDKSKRIRCQKEGCGHSVYAAIHVVEHEGRLKVLGSTCFAEIYGGELSLGRPVYVGGGQKLGAEDAELLDANTAALIASWELAKIESEKRNREKFRLIQARLVASARLGDPSPPPSSHQVQHGPSEARRAAVTSPWSWQHTRNYSIALVRSPEGQAWFRVQHQDLTQKLVPWPIFEGWERALPSAVGFADPAIGGYSVPDIGKAFRELAAMGFSHPSVGVWSELRRLL